VEFKPTWLYIKRHRLTGLKYFGKTVRDPIKYAGSGRYWKKHIKIHSRDIETIWCELFTDKELLVEFAKLFSEFYNIVGDIDINGNKIWANEVPEDGLQGGQNAGLPSPLKGVATGRPGTWKNKKRPEHSDNMKGRKKSLEHSAKISAALKKHVRTPEHNAKLANSKRGRPNLKLSEALRAKPLIMCPHCNKQGRANMTRYHFDNCKLKGNKNGKIF
jgi:hypothetical protein